MMIILAALFATADGACFRRLGWGNADANGDGSIQVILENGLLYAWGDNYYSTTGAWTNEMDPVGRPSQTRYITDVFSVSTGYYHTCALQWNGTAYCWGYGDGVGNLGTGTATETTTNYPMLPLMQMGGKYADIQVGEGYTCFIGFNDGFVYCYGDNDNGQLGTAAGSPANSPTALRIGTIANATAVATGESHACAVTSSGQLWCWGDNSDGKLGVGSQATINAPTLVALTDVIGVAAGEDNTCAWTASGAGYCWGDNDNFETGTGTSGTDQNSPAMLPSSLGTIIKIGTAEDHSCALNSLGQLWCWGYGGDGELGIGTYDDLVDSPGIPAASTIPALLNVKDFQVTMDATCAITLDDRLLCWGESDYVSNPTYGDTGDDIATPTEISTALFDCSSSTGSRGGKGAKGAKGGNGGKAKKAKKVAGALIGGAVAGVALVGLAVRHRRKKNYAPIGTPAAVAV